MSATADGPSRRSFIKGAGAAMAASRLAACGDAPPQNVIPYAEQPEDMVPGRPRFYATAFPYAGFVQAVLAETHMGRPTKLEGNPDHPVSQGATDAFTQAAVTELYNPDRSRTILRAGAEVGWEDFADMAAGLAGPGLRILTGAVGSPTLFRQLQALGERGARWHLHEPWPAPFASVGGAVLRPRLDRAAVVVSLGDDLLGPGPAQVHNLRNWSVEGGGRRRLMVAEPSLTLTGAAAQSRLAVPERRLSVLAQAIAAELDGGNFPESAPAEAEWARWAAAALAANAGRSLLTAGSGLPSQVHRSVLAVNEALGNAGRTVLPTEPALAKAPDGARSFAMLVEDMAAGAVSALVVIGANPAYTSPAGIDFAAALARVPVTVHAGLYPDETAALCRWHLPLAHPLEDWSDGRAVDGTASIIQPVIPPVFRTYSAHAILAALLGEPAARPHDIVRDTWRAVWGEDAFAERWRRSLLAGFIAETAAGPARPRPGEEPSAPPPAGDGLEVVFLPDPSIGDGRFAAVPFLQELPKPLTKLTWDNVIGLSARLAARLGIENGDMIALSAQTGEVIGPAWVLPGQAEETVTLFLGYGRRQGAGEATGRGYDAYRLMPAGGESIGATIRKAEGRARLAVTQPWQTLAGRDDIIRTVAPGEALPREPERPSLYPEWPYPGPAWGMAIDLAACGGCNACVVACQIENSVPYVGPEQVAMGREMHWLRVDVYYGDRGAVHFQPIPCMHCEKAPCEMGCPVNATVHGPEGLNQMIYNRCIGTRTCSSYCPYKVRRFNFFDYAGAMPAAYSGYRNPDVTVRGRGVMEKCTYCTQRIAQARIEARKEDRPLRDGEVVTACQQVCPSRAIVFGDLADPDSAVSRARRGPRNYLLLGELGTRPRTSYLAKIEEG